MSASTYSLTIANPLSTHGFKAGSLLADREMPKGMPYSDQEIEAIVASGDCFVTIATKLDKLAQLLTGDSKVVGPEMDQVTQLLLHLQRYYSVVRKIPRQHSDR